MMRFAFLLCSLLAPLPALALSCMPQTVENTYQRVAAAPEEYIVVHGRLTFRGGKLPSGGLANQPQPKQTRVSAEILGKSLSKAGFKVPFDQKVTLEIACYGPWCGSAQSGQDVLAFLKRGTEGYSLEINPCGGDVFTAPKPAMIKQVKTCFNGGTCKARKR